MKNQMRVLLVSFFLVLVTQVALAPGAMADDTETFRGLIAEATKLAYEGKFDEAVTKYIQAKTFNDDPLIDFNIARCYHKKGDCGAAVHAYNSFLSRADATEADVNAANDYLTELGTCETGSGVVVATDPVTPKDGGDTTNDPATTDSNNDQGNATGEVSTVGSGDTGGGTGGSDTGGSGYTYAAWGTAIGGGLLLATGITLDVMGASLVDDYEAAATAGNQSEYDQLANDIQSRQLMVYALYGLGVAAAAAGGVMILLDDGPSDASTWHMAPLVAPDTAGVQISGPLSF